MLEFKNLSVWYTRKAARIESVSHSCIRYEDQKIIIRNADFGIGSHSVTGLLGINGAGKTTLINTVSGIHEMYRAGCILFQDHEITPADDEFRLQRYTVFTDSQAFQYWTFCEYKDYIEKVYQKKADAEYLEYLIQGFRFEEYQNQYIKNLSTGNKKKVFLIAGFALQLPLLILDEPLDGLDFDSAEFLYQALREHKKYGSVFMSSHIAESFERTCDKVLLLDQGRISSRAVTEHTDIRKELKEWLNE